MTKLTGTAYINHWAERIARGPEQVGHGDYSLAQTEAQGDLIFDFLRPELVRFAPSRVQEFGSGYGRMLKRLRTVWPQALMVGIDLCREAIEGSWRDDKTFLECDELPSPAPFDVSLTITVLQHVTDDDIFHSACHRLAESKALILFENVHQTRAAHMRDTTSTEYMACFPGFHWSLCGELEIKSQPHALLVGVKL